MTRTLLLFDLNLVFLFRIDLESAISIQLKVLRINFKVPKSNIGISVADHLCSLTTSCHKNSDPITSRE